MRQTVAQALLICLLVAGDGLAQVNGTSDHRAWLRENAVTVRSIDPEDEDFTDLEPLKQRIGDARVVGLGEQTHGDGATFHAKTRLIKFLHQEMGFDVLVWESGMYDCQLVDQAVRGGEPMKTAWREGIFGIWGMSEQVQPLFKYVDATRKTDRPLEVAGMDAQITGQQTIEELDRHLADLFDRAGQPESLSHSFAALHPIFQKMTERLPNISLYDWRTTIMATQSLCGDLNQSDGILSSAVPQRERSMMDRALRNLATVVEIEHWMRRMQARPAQAQQHRLNVALARESAMAETLIWLAQEYYADRKLIVWAASSHLTYNSRTVEMSKEDGAWKFDDAEWEPMGNAVHDALGDDLYVIDFIAYSGTIGSVMGWSRDLEPAPEGSIDAICHGTEQPYLFVDLKTLPDQKEGGWLRDRLIARPRGYAPMRADWSNVCDAFFFTDQMYPSTRVVAPAD